MNAFQQVLLIAGAQGLLLSLALIVSGWTKKKPAVFLGIILVVSSIELLNAWAMGIQYHQGQNVIPFWILGSYLLLPPSLWLFLQTSFNRLFKLSANYLYSFIPAFIEIAVEFYSFYLHKYSGQRLPFLTSVVWTFLTEVMPIAGIIVVIVVSVVGFTKHRTTTTNGRKRMVFLLVFSALAILWLTDTLLHIAVYPIIEGILCASLFCLGYVVYFRPAFFEGQSLEKRSVANEQFLNYDPEKAVVDLKYLFDVKKIYLKPKLTVEEVASELGLPDRYLSYLINNVCNSNFSTFVNTYRVNEVLGRLKNPRELNKNLLGIALDSGFGSKSSFNAAFRSITGQSPSAYLSKNSK